MSQITNGKVSYGRTVKTGDYENKRADVEIGFNVGEGEDESEVLSRASNLAKYKCELLLGIAKELAPAEQPSVPVSTTHIAAAAAPAAANPTRRGPAKKPPVIDVVLTDEEKAEAAAKAKAATDAKADTASLDGLEEGLTEAEVAEAAGGDVSSIDDLLGADAQPITDQALVEAITAKNVQINNAVAIKRVIGKFVNPPKTVREIPAELRQAFLDELNKL